MGDLSAYKDYDIEKITRILLKMRDACERREGEAYDDPERDEKYRALQDAIDLINNQSIGRELMKRERDAAIADLKDAEAASLDCLHCRYYKTPEEDMKCVGDCLGCAADCMCRECNMNSKWEWRGLPEEDEEK